MPHYINAVEPYNLDINLLLEEFWSIQHVFKIARRARENKVKRPLPTVYNPGGEGCLTFFFNKLTYLNKRHLKIVALLKEKGVRPPMDFDLRNTNADFPASDWQDWTPSEGDIEANRQFLRKRMARKQRRIAHMSV